MMNLSRLEDFAPWLSQDDNIALLADAVGLDITVDETEFSVGDFNVDIFASETERIGKSSSRNSWRTPTTTTLAS